MASDEKNYQTPDEAEAAFYRAFIDADIESMMSVWHDADYIECIHPMGERLRGIAAVKHSWESILKAAPRINLELEDAARVHYDNLAIHTVTEDITIENKERQHAKMLATNIYQRNEQGWKLILHHASPLVSSGNKSDNQASKVLH